jgi:hypothetical protein
LGILGWVTPWAGCRPGFKEFQPLQGTRYIGWLLLQLLQGTHFIGHHPLRDRRDGLQSGDLLIEHLGLTVEGSGQFQTLFAGQIIAFNVGDEDLLALRVEAGALVCEREEKFTDSGVHGETSFRRAVRRPR